MLHWKNRIALALTVVAGAIAALNGVWGGFYW